MTKAADGTGGRPGWAPPVGTQRRIRSRAIWAVALFAASFPPAIVSAGIINVAPNQANVAMPMAFGFWLIGLLFALWAAFPTLRYWEALPGHVRWLGALPLLTVSLFLSVVLLASVLI